MEVTLSLNPATIPAMICVLCGVLSIYRASLYFASTRNYDFVSPMFGMLAVILGGVEIGLGVMIFFLPTSIGVIILSSVLAFLGIGHTILGFMFAKDAWE